MFSLFSASAASSKIRVFAHIRYLMCAINKTYQVQDIKNSHLVTVHDNDNVLPYMQEIFTEDGNSGVVLKLQQRSRAIIGFYHPFQKIDKFTIKSSESIKNQRNMMNFQYAGNKVLDVNLNQIQKIQPKTDDHVQYKPIQIAKQKIKIESPSPILSVCQNIYYGDFLNFSGGLGSKRTSHALQLLKSFTNSSQNNYGVYINTNMKDQSIAKIVAGFPNCMAFGRSDKKSNLTSVGVYMLALKASLMARKLTGKTNHTMLIMDNFNQIMANQWTVLQNLNLPIAPQSILNEIYSLSSYRTNKIKHMQCSTTTITITNPQDQDVIQEYTTLGNNSKHLRTLGKHINFPLNLKKNHTIIPDSQQIETLKKFINQYLQQKSQTQLQWKMKFHKDEPWQHYFLYDAEWWIPALKNYSPKSFADRDLLIWFLNRNIENEYSAHWRISCVEAYQKYKQFLAQPQNLRSGINEQQLQNFIEIAKHERYFDIIKKDYL